MLEVFVLFKKILFFIAVLGVHCGMYKSSYDISNISCLNSPPPSFSFILSPHPNSWIKLLYFEDEVANSFGLTNASEWCGFRQKQHCAVEPWWLSHRTAHVLT
jgi:hypothetical protein